MASKNDCYIVGICGSLRKNSLTRKTLKIALEGANNAGTKTHLLDLREYNLPFCHEYESEIEFPDSIKVDVSGLRNEVRNAHGIIFATPEYHGSFSGVLKNAIDLMGFSEFEGKVIGLIGVAGGSIGAINSLNGLRVISRQLHAWVLPQQISIANSSSSFDANGNLIDKRLEKRVIEIGANVAKFSVLHNNKERALEFLTSWEQAAQNPGGKAHPKNPTR